MPRRRGNPNWASGGQPLHPGRTAATEFEMQVRQLRLTKETCASSAELRTWCERNRNRCYIPEWLLYEWEMPVNPNVGWGIREHQNRSPSLNGYGVRHSAGQAFN